MPRFHRRPRPAFRLPAVRLPSMCLALVLTLPSLALSGCGNSDETVPGANALKTTAPAKKPEPKSKTRWFVYRMDGQSVGRLALTVEQKTWKGVTEIQRTAESQLRMLRQGQPTEIRLRFTNWETPAGQLLRIAGEAHVGSSPIQMVGRVQGDVLTIDQETAGQTQTLGIPWKLEYLGFFGVETSLEGQPMQPGEKRTLHKLEPLVNQVVQVDLTALAVEPTDVLGQTVDLLRIDSRLTFGDGAVLETILWTDPAGVAHKTYSRSDSMEACLTTREQALSSGASAQFDLMTHTRIPLNRPLPNPHHEPAVYRLSFQQPGEAPPGAQQRLIDLIPSRPGQVVQAQDDHTVTVAVRRITPTTAIDPPESGPTDADRLPNAMIQSDDTEIVRLARQAVGAQRDPWKQAAALQQFVHNYIDRKDFSQAFSSASDVARRPQGDCTEHAVLLAALSRASGLPSRVALGLVYTPSPSPGLSFHMWTELYLVDRWVPFDATLPSSTPVSGGHLLLSTTPLTSTSSYTSFLPISHLMHRLSVHVLDP